ncbi:flavodoxin family protein [Desulfosporosinus fructosivorans]|uniref:Flavodoxin family protein n=1 Tax=Desulfosporosinus fructosivorans TaxID=2018669 RepID=A0A4Z0R782_9FIRM|nr:flavodoxin family protein [Desulfosporosinus fructosivorans]TGE37516.1 flavodoxin family protein [Desulfosporosinus fructosivorans]
MKFIVFNGSPAAAGSNTNVIAQAFLSGAKRAGAETENIFVIEKNIGHCKGCFSCWFKTPGKCVLQDDMQGLIEQYNSADVVCFASPVYTWNMTAALKNFADRLAPLKSPLIVNRNDNFDLADAVSKTQQFIVISNCGFPGNNNFETMKVVFASCNPVLEIYRNCGKLLQSKDEKIKRDVDDYLKAVEQAGYEMATQNNISEETEAGLQKELMSIPEYVKYIGM